jgi:hypothetical protein
MMKNSQTKTVQEFWSSRIVLNELEQEKYLEKIVPIIEQHWKSMDAISGQVGAKEVLRLKAALLNNYFLDLEKVRCKNDV